MTPMRAEEDVSAILTKYFSGDGLYLLFSNEGHVAIYDYPVNCAQDRYCWLHAISSKSKLPNPNSILLYLSEIRTFRSEFFWCRDRARKFALPRLPPRRPHHTLSGTVICSPFRVRALYLEFEPNLRIGVRIVQRSNEVWVIVADGWRIINIRDCNILWSIDR